MSALRPGQALTVKETMLVVESAQLMAAKRCDCVLVVNENDHLSGIFTVKTKQNKKNKFLLKKRGNMVRFII